MRTHLLFAAILMLFPFAAHAQLGLAPTVPDGISVTSFVAHLDPYDPLPQKRGPFTSVWTVVVWNLPDGTKALVLDPTLLHISDSASVIDGIGTAAVFDLLAAASVANAIALGYLPPAASDNQPRYTIVRFPSRVSRSGSGSWTTFLACGMSTATEAYRYAAHDGVPTITKLGITTDGGGESWCERTVVEDGLE